MATAQQIAERALRRARLVDRFATSYPAELVEDALATLNEMVQSWPAYGLNTLSVTVEGDTTDASPIITNIEDTGELAITMSVSGTGIPATTYIESVDSKHQITLTNNATATGADITLTCAAVPFDSRFESGVIALLARRLCSDFGRQIDQTLNMDADSGWSALCGAFQQVPDVEFDPALTRRRPHGLI